MERTQALGYPLRRDKPVEAPVEAACKRCDGDKFICDVCDRPCHKCTCTLRVAKHSRCPACQRGVSA